MSDDVRFAREIDAAPGKVFDAFTRPDGQEAFYGKDDPGWIVESDCDLRLGGVWTIAFGPSRAELYRHEHVFRVIDRPRRLVVDTTETRLDGSILEFETEFEFKERDGKTVMTMTQRGLPTAELREEHRAGVPNAFARLEQAIEANPSERRGRDMTTKGDSRKLILQMGISMDGYVAVPGENGLTPVMEGGTGLGAEDPELTRTKLAWAWEAGAHLMGRVTYEEMASYWPSSTHDYAAPMNEIPKVVFSKSIERAEWPESQIARGNLAEEIAALKGTAGKDMIAWGGARFAQSLARLGLIDQYRLVTHPVAVANGEPLFKDLSSPVRLRVVEKRTFKNAEVQVYEPA